MADQLRAAASRAPLTIEALDRLRAVEELLGVAIIDDSVEAALIGDDIASVLVPGARVCFTGTAEDEQGRIVDREEIQDLAASPIASTRVSRPTTERVPPACGRCLPSGPHQLSRGPR